MMKKFYLFFIAILLHVNFLIGQVISPYLEINDTQLLNLLDNDSVINNYTFHHLLGISNQEFYYSYRGDETIDLKFIVPNRNNENIYQLTAEYNEQSVELKSTPIKNIQNQINQLKKNSSYENKLLIENSILKLPQIKKGNKIKITLKKAITLHLDQIKYYYSIPKLISIRTNEYSFTKKDIYKIQPKKVINHLIFSGNTLFEEITNNGKSTNTFNSKKVEHSDQLNELKKITFQYQSDDINSTITSTASDDCTYYFGTIQPPKNYINDTPKEIIFVIDGSGSMKGKPIEMIKTSVGRILNQLDEQDKFNILIYAAENTHFSSISLPVTQENIQKANQFGSREFGSGNLKLNQAFNRIDQLKINPNSNRIIAIMSDGDLDFDQNIHVAIQQQMKNAQIFLLGVGNEINYKTFHYFELVTGSKPIVINDLNQAQSKLSTFEYQLTHPTLKNIRIQSKNLQNNTFPNHFNGYLSNENLHFISKDCNQKNDKQFTIKGNNGNTIYDQNISIYPTNNLDEAFKFYWAKEKIAHLIKEENRCGEMCKRNKTYQYQIEQIAKMYNISSPYTFLTQKESELISNDFDFDDDTTPDWFDECPFEFGPTISKGCNLEGLKNQTKNNYIQDASNEILRIVEFDLDKDIIRPIDYKNLDEIVSLLNQNTQLHFYLIGHTDARGTKNYNQDLSLRRSKAVFEYLTNHGISPQRLTIIGKGDTTLKHKECIPAEKCEEWKNLQNRRVELKIKKD